MTKRNIAWQRIVLAVGVALAFIFSVSWGVNHRARAQEYKKHLDALYNRAFDEALDGVGSLETALSKIVAANSQQQYCALLSQAVRISSETAAAVSQMGSYSEYSQLNKFLIQSGDYCSSLLKKTASAQPITDAEIDGIAQLQRACLSVSEQLSAARDANKSVSIAIPSDAGVLAPQEREHLLSNDSPQQRYPQLIYDGPFSDSTQKLTPQGLGDKKYGANDAKSAARTFVANELLGDLEQTADSDGRIASYGFSGKAHDGRTFEIFITKIGARTLWMRMDDRQDPSAELPTQEKALELAEIGRQYLEDRSFPSMRPTYAQYYGGTALINYAYNQGGVIVYNDLIKVWIEINTGRVVGFESQNYLFSHVPRSIPQPELTPLEARQRLSPRLTVKDTRKALIPVSPAKEKLCYEFKCEFDGDFYLVYINAETGVEEQILRIIDSSTGVLVL